MNKRQYKKLAKKTHKISFKIGDKVTYNDCLFQIKKIDFKRQKYLCQNGHSITFISQKVWQPVC
jgi:hypothetical protein